MGVLHPYLSLRRASGQQLYIRTLVPRDAAWKQDGIGFSIVQYELDRSLGISEGEGIVGNPLGVAMDSRSQPIGQQVRLEVFQPFLADRMQEAESLATHTLTLVEESCSRELASLWSMSVLRGMCRLVARVDNGQ